LLRVGSKHVQGFELKRAALSVLAAAVSALAITASPAAAGTTVEMLSKGSFEDTGGAAPEGWGGLTYYAGGVWTIPGWIVEAGSVDLTTSGSFWGPAADGNFSLDINGWSAGTISQSFETVAGRLYTVAFAYSRNVAGAPNPALALVSAGGESLNVSAANNAAFGSGHNMQWKTDGFTFVGTGQATKLTLAAGHGGNGGVFFDDVSVSGAVPEPATWALMIGGFGLAGAALRRRRAVAAVA
jgi:hypothetical protein